MEESGEFGRRVRGTELWRVRVELEEEKLFLENNLRVKMLERDQMCVKFPNLN